MKTPRKLTRPDSHLTQLKLLWRDSLSEPEQDYWREQFESARPQSELRQELQNKYHLNLLYDMQLTRFRRWVDDQDALAAEAQKAAADQAALEQQGLTIERLRDELIRRMQTRALSRGDFNLGLKAIGAEVRVQALQLSREKFQAAQRTKLETGLAEVAKGFKANSQAMESYEKACEIVERDAKT